MESEPKLEERAQYPTLGKKWLEYAEESNLSAAIIIGYATELSHTLKQKGVFKRKPEVEVFIQDNIEFIELKEHRTKQILYAIYENLETVEYEAIAREGTDGFSIGNLETETGTLDMGVPTEL